MHCCCSLPLVGSTRSRGPCAEFPSSDSCKVVSLPALILVVADPVRTKRNLPQKPVQGQRQGSLTVTLTSCTEALH